MYSDARLSIIVATERMLKKALASGYEGNTQMHHYKLAQGRIVGEPRGEIRAT